MNTQFQSILAKKLAKKEKLNGFTLVELMVVIVIVGILSAVALPQLTQAQNRAKDSVAKSELVAATKDCSMVLLIDGAGTAYGGDYDTVSGNCDFEAELKATSEGGTVYVSEMTEDGLPGPITVKTA